MGEGGEKTKKNHAREDNWKKAYKEEVKEKSSAELIALTRIQTVFAWEATWQPLYTAVYR